MQNKYNNKKGFTIIETMIAISIFLIVVTIGMGALLNANLIHQKSHDMRSIMDNMSFIMEDMSRNLRTGSTYRCITAPEDLDTSVVGDPQSGANCWGVAFEIATGDRNNADDQWVYYIDNAGKILKSTEGPYNNVSNFIQLTPDEVVIDTAQSGFVVTGAKFPPGDTAQPFVTIKLVGTITYKNVATPFSLRTSVSQRALDI